MLVDSYANFKYLFQFLFAFSYCATTIKSFFFLITCLLLIKACLKFLSLTNFSNLLSFDKSVIHSSPIFCRKLRIKIIISNEIILHLTSVLLELEEGVKHKLVSSNLMYDLCINKQHNIFFFVPKKHTVHIPTKKEFASCPNPEVDFGKFIHLKLTPLSYNGNSLSFAHKSASKSNISISQI